MTTFVLRNYQEECLDAFWNYFENNSGNPLFVLPTGSGKSLVQASMIESVLKEIPEKGIICVTHVKELIGQNVDKYLKYFPDTPPIGVYCASLKQKENDAQVTFASIQSIFKRAHEFRKKHLLFIDECHLVPKKDQGMYKQFINGLLELNPNLKVIGLTATPFRLDSGLLHRGDGRIFTDIAYNLPIKWLIENGYLCKLIDKHVMTDIDLSKARVRAGDYIMADIGKIMDKEELISQTINEIIEYCKDRNHWLIFCSTIEHAKHVRDQLRAKGINTESIHSKMSTGERDKIIHDFQNKKIRALTNVNVLTTGFDAPFIDALILLRPTKSVGLYIQMVGRGLRISSGKKDCLVLDFAENILTHGPLDKIEIKEGKDSGDDRIGTVPQKMCPQCENLVHLRAKYCQECHHVFIDQLQYTHQSHACDGSILSKVKPPKKYKVNHVIITYYDKKEIPSVKVSYYLENGNFSEKIVSEWVCFEHEGFAKKQAFKWFEEMQKNNFSIEIEEFPRDCIEALDIFAVPIIIWPSYITVNENEKFPRIVEKIWEEKEEESFAWDQLEKII